MSIDDWLLSKHQAIFDEIEYRYELTTAQVAEATFLIMWLVYGIRHVLSADGFVYMAYIVAMAFVTTWMCRRDDRAIRADRKTDALATLATRKLKPFVVMRLLFVFMSAFCVVVLTLTGKWLDTLNSIGMVLNVMAIYFFVCINDVDGTKRRAMEYDEAEKSMEKEHATW